MCLADLRSIVTSPLPAPFPLHPLLPQAIGKKFGTGATVGKSPSNPNIAVVDVQGDVTDGIADLLFALYKIPEKLLVFK